MQQKNKLIPEIFFRLHVYKVPPTHPHSCFVLFGISADTFAQAEVEIEAIKSVITRETSSFMNVDRQGWSETWMKTPYAYWSYADSSASSFVDGWQAINKTFDQYFRTQKPSQQELPMHGSMLEFTEMEPMPVYSNTQRRNRYGSNLPSQGTRKRGREMENCLYRGYGRIS